MINFNMDGAGSVLSSGTQGFVTVPFTCTLNQWVLVADVTGTLSVDVRRTTYANWSLASLVLGNSSIVGTEKPTLSSVSKNQDTTITTWSGITAGDILTFHIDATPTNVTKATLMLYMN
jgi:hypothetical protein